MSYRITQLHSLMLYEFTQVEGDIAGISDRALKLALPAGTTLSALLNNVERGEWALLTDTPNSALLEQAPNDDGELKWRINPTLKNQLEPSARSAYNQRLKLVNDSGSAQASKSTSNDLGASTYYVPPVIEPEPSRLTPYERYKKTVAMQQKEIEDFWREKDARDEAKRERKRRERELAAQREAVPDSNNLDILHQSGKLEKDANGFYRTADLGTHSSVSELMESGALPGTQGVTLTDRTVRFGDLYDLGTLDGRKIEFSLTTERVDGKLVKRLYSGDDYTSPVPKDSRLIGHVHPNDTSTQMWPSPEDMNVVNARYFRELQVDSSAQPKPTRIFWGSGNTDNTVFYPGFGKVPLSYGGQK